MHVVTFSLCIFISTVIDKFLGQFLFKIALLPLLRNSPKFLHNANHVRSKIEVLTTCLLREFFLFYSLFCLSENSFCFSFTSFYRAVHYLLCWPFNSARIINDIVLVGPSFRVWRHWTVTSDQSRSTSTTNTLTILTSDISTPDDFRVCVFMFEIEGSVTSITIRSETIFSVKLQYFYCNIVK